MPGVPSGRGCDACRKQKKKCDGARPSCSRCQRLHIPCIGAGERRFVFKEQKQFQSASPPKRTQQPDGTACDQQRDLDVDIIERSPSNELASTISIFVESFKPSTDLRFNLSWNFGSFFEYIPKRMGINEALDSSVVALSEAHRNLSCRAGVTALSLSKYSTALRKLRVCLDDPRLASTSETLCAVMVLMICQTFLGAPGSRSYASHCRGAALILKARGWYYDPADDLESQLLLSLRGPLVVEGLMSDEVQFTPLEWKALVQNHLDSDGRPEGKIMSCLARMPELMRRARNDNALAADPALSLDVSSDYQRMLVLRTELRGLLSLIESRIANKEANLHLLNLGLAHFQRIYALALATLITLGVVLNALHGEDSSPPLDLYQYATEILDLSKQAAIYRPLGSSSISLCLCFAWIGVRDMELRSAIESVISEWNEDFPSEPGMPSLMDSLRDLEKRFCLLKI